jgi:beta-lactamase regulating signal transducer with metallopeptidase domain
MNTFPLTILWLQILALIVMEVGVVVVLFAVIQRVTRTAGWRRTVCQTALVTSLLIVGSELSGGGRGLMSRFLAKNKEPQNITEHNQAPLTPSDGEREKGDKHGLEAKFRARVVEQLARNQSQAIAERESLSRSGATGPSSAYAIYEPSKVKLHSMATDRTVIRWLGTVLAGGIVLVLGRACFGRLLLVVLGSRRKAVGDAELLRQVEVIARSLKISRRIRIIESRRLVSPIAFGLLRPTIGLPLNFSARYPRTKQKAMLTHELAHLAAHDPFWYFVADSIAALLWWHPGIWWLRRQLQLSSELAADEASLMSTDGPRVLAECLVEMGAQLVKPAPGQLRVAGFRSDLGCRVQRLMGLEGTQWRPISRARTIAARSIGPIAVSLTIILCTAWAVPRQLTKGDSMNSMKQNWQRTLAAFATMAAIQTPAVLATQESSLPPATPAAAGGLAPTTALPAAENPATAGTRTGNFAPPGGSGFGASNRGMPEGIAGARAQHYGKLEGKLREIVIDEVKLDGLPLSEVLNFLGETSRERDPEKKGINFLIDPNQPQFVPSGPGSIDPATGLPMPVATEPIDVNSISVRFNMPLRHVTLADVLDAIVRVADRPIQYSVEDYAVIFSLRPDANVAPPMSGRAPAPAQLAVRTFHVDTNTFAGGLESAFGIKVETKGKGESQSRKVQSALKELLAQLNIPLEGNKAIFYNELTGTVMVRAAGEDLDVIQAAIETLGGQAMSDYAMRSPQGVPGTRPERYGTRW